MRLATVLGAALLATALATPAVAAPCKAPRQLKLQWDASSGKGQMYFVAHGCALPAACPASSGSPIAKLPLHMSLRQGEATLFQTDLKGCEGKDCNAQSSGGCRGGADVFKSPAGLVKLSYLPKGTASMMVRARGGMNRPPEVQGPVTVSLTDASGYTAEATFEKCRSAARESNVAIVCR